ncbi:hypothetical protein AKJ51_05045 [candidate division MSBL1 archaeon SCGC-AAA382A20]|uniref:Calcineurin-like phosphoesterase domain-containing protein n=1 Tax=candidate division MSBL1 archaeon SCGC-AAA382A20 TaxID=1698280 RepID=A0A133VG71_9EURY|nr:hypothetical protein AKJ51_05045 [candidate division MSBL1 archaeon SCGC-AAA382A20]
MKIFHISDTHISDDKHFNKNALEKALRELNSGPYDIVIHSGDVTESGRLEQYRKAEKLFKGIDIPFVVIPGNHDKRSGGFSLYQEYIGEANGVKEGGDSVIIYVDTGVPDANIGRVGMSKFEMIRDNLHKYQKKSIKIVNVHHHILPVPRAGRERNVLSNAGDLLELFLKMDVDLVLSGHRHYPNVHKIEDTVIVNAGTVSGRKTRHGEANSYNVIEIDESEIKVTTQRMKSSREVNSFPRKESKVFYDFGEREFRIVQVSNTFISSLTESRLPNTTKFKHTHYTNAVDSINNIEADLVVHCGGIVEEGISRNYELADEYLSRIEPPIVYTPAGRDINYLGYHLFQEYFGNLDQSYAEDDIFLQGVSSAQYDSPVGIVGDTERKELFKKMNEREETFKGLFLHHNVVPIPHSREKGLLEDSGDILRKVVDENIDLVLTGTSSHPFAAKVGNTLVSNVNALSSVYQRSRYGNSFNLVDVYNNAIVISEINSLWGNRRLLGIWKRNNSND